MRKIAPPAYDRARLVVKLLYYPPPKALLHVIGGIRGLSYRKDLDESSEIVRSDVPDFDAIFQKLAAGRRDATIGATVGLMYYAKASGYQTGCGDRLVLSTVEVCIQTPIGKSDTPAVQTMVKALEGLRADGTAAAIVNKYGNDG